MSGWIENKKQNERIDHFNVLLICCLRISLSIFHSALFPSCLATIKECHSWFMEQLENRMKSEDWSGGIGDILGKMAGPLKVSFCSMQFYLQKYISSIKDPYSIMILFALNKKQNKENLSWKWLPDHTKFDFGVTKDHD